MKEKHSFLYLCLSLSLLLHLFLFYLTSFNYGYDNVKKERPRALVSIEITHPPVEKPPEKVVLDLPEPPQAVAPLPLPVEKPIVKPAKKPMPIKKATPRPKQKKAETLPQNKLPVSNTRKKENASPDAKNIKPVFGLNQDSLSPSGESNFSVRAGNTLMQAQEEAFTPPQEVKTYTTVPVFELSAMPVFKTPIKPVYPASLKNKEIEGGVLLSVTIDEAGKVVEVSVKRSDNDLFSQAAIAALKQSVSTPGMQNGKPVAVTIDVTIKFILDE